MATVFAPAHGAGPVPVAAQQSQSISGGIGNEDSGAQCGTIPVRPTPMTTGPNNQSKNAGGAASLSARFGLLAVVAALIVGFGGFYAGSQWTAANTPPVQGTGASQQASGAPFKVFSTIQELMEGIVDPAADGVWEAVAVISSETGVEERQPRTAEEWQAVRLHALNLLEAMNLLVIEDRQTSRPVAEPHFGEHPPEVINAQIRANRADFVAFADDVRNKTLEALAAIDKQDVQGLVVAGGRLDEACEACHITFWYSIPTTTPPPAKR